MKNQVISTFRSTPILSMMLLLSGFGALFFGAYSMSIAEVFHSAILAKGDASHYLIWNIRLPRILLAGLIGGGLAISGAAIQGLFRNPLADQTLIGVTSGAMLFAVLSILFMSLIAQSLPPFLHQFIIAAFAFTGGLITTLGVFWLSSKNGRTSVITMLLAGIAISAFAAAITGLLLYVSDDQQLRDITFWSLGSFSGANWIQISIIVPVILTGIIVILKNGKALNAILLGESEAAYLGIPVEKVKTRLIIWTALIVGACISMSGIIGFVGLVIPHFLRLLIGTDYRYLLRSSVLVGAIFMILADTLARTIIAPAELPIGILTAMIGAPFFLWLLIKSQRKSSIL